MPCPGRFTPGKDMVPIVQEAGWDPGPVWTGVENLAPNGIWSPDRPVRSESLYRPTVVELLGNNFKFIYFWNVFTSWSVLDSMTLDKWSQICTKVGCHMNIGWETATFLKTTLLHTVYSIYYKIQEASISKWSLKHVWKKRSKIIFHSCTLHVAHVE
jgi:hypothetical protein